MAEKINLHCCIDSSRKLPFHVAVKVESIMTAIWRPQVGQSYLNKHTPTMTPTILVSLSATCESERDRLLVCLIHSTQVGVVCIHSNLK
jgi:hypothetical protein